MRSKSHVSCLVFLKSLKILCTVIKCQRCSRRSYTKPISAPMRLYIYEEVNSKKPRDDTLGEVIAHILRTLTLFPIIPGSLFALFASCFIVSSATNCSFERGVLDKRSNWRFEKASSLFEMLHYSRTTLDGTKFSLERGTHRSQYTWNPRWRGACVRKCLHESSQTKDSGVACNN